MFNKAHTDIPGSSRLFLENGEAISSEIRLIPAPSNDPNDPLNWTSARKYLNLSCVFLYTIATGVVSSVLYSVYEPLGDANGLSLDDLNSGQGYMYLFIGISCLISQPGALAIGKRPVYIASSLAAGFVLLWVIYGQGNGNWIAGRLVLGFVLTPQFTLVEVSIADVFFMHERAFMLGSYGVALYVGVTLGPLLSGYVNDSLGYKGVIWLSSGFCWLTGVVLFVFLEETNFIRDNSSEALAHGRPEIIRPVSDETDSGDIEKEGKRSPSQVEELPQPRVLSKYSMKGFWKFAKPHPYSGGIMLRGLLQPLALARLPILLWCALQFGMYQVYFNFISSLTSGVLSQDPYNFSSSAIGLTFLGPMLSSIPGALFGGRIADYFAIRKAKRNHGMSEPEDKLQLFIVPLVGMVIGLLMMGLGPYYEAHWIVFVLGCSIVNFVGPIATVLAFAYAFDCYHSIRPDSMEGPTAAAQDTAPYLLTIVLLGMIVAFGFGYAITPWCFTWGYLNFGVSAALTSILINGSAYLMIWKGRSLRRSGEAYYRKVINK